jgi:hypothetical protein
MAVRIRTELKEGDMNMVTYGRWTKSSKINVKELINMPI